MSINQRTCERLITILSIKLYTCALLLTIFDKELTGKESWLFGGYSPF